MKMTKMIKLITMIYFEDNNSLLLQLITLKYRINKFPCPLMSNPMADSNWILIHKVIKISKLIQMTKTMTMMRMKIKTNMKKNILNMNKVT